MLREHDNQQVGMEFVCIEELVLKDHLLRKIDRVVDFGFIQNKVKDLYCADNRAVPALRRLSEHEENGLTVR